MLTRAWASFSATSASVPGRFVQRERQGLFPAHAELRRLEGFGGAGRVVDKEANPPAPRQRSLRGVDGDDVHARVLEGGGYPGQDAGFGREIEA
jgi:hypothetical protein